MKAKLIDLIGYAVFLGLVCGIAWVVSRGGAITYDRALVMAAIGAIAREMMDSLRLEKRVKALEDRR